VTFVQLYLSFPAMQLLHIAVDGFFVNASLISMVVCVAFQPLRIVDNIYKPFFVQRFEQHPCFG
jgi:hypothetical protein